MTTIFRVEPTEEHLRPLMEFLIGQIDEATLAPVDTDAATRNMWATVNAGMTFAAIDPERGIVGSIALNAVSVAWYAPPDAVMLVDEWFLVSKAARGGEVGKLLLKAAADEATTRGLQLFVRRVGASAIRADVLGFNVVGRITKLR